MRPGTLFVYGTLLFPEVFEAVAGRLPRSSEAVLKDWAAFRLRDAGYPGLRARPGAETPGRAYFEVDAATSARLDRFEGEIYRVELVEIRCAGTVHAASVYVIGEPHLELLSDEPWDPERFRAHHYAVFLEACRGFADGSPP